MRWPGDDNVSSDQEMITDKIFADTNVWVGTTLEDGRLFTSDATLRYSHVVNIFIKLLSMMMRMWHCDTVYPNQYTWHPVWQYDSVTGYEGLPSCCCLGCCCCCCWCQVLLLQLEVLSWPIRSSYCQFSPNERAVKCNLSSHPPQHASHLSCWAWTGPNIKKREPGCLYFTYTHKNYTVACYYMKVYIDKNIHPVDTLSLLWYEWYICKVFKANICKINLDEKKYLFCSNLPITKLI